MGVNPRKWSKAKEINSSSETEDERYKRFSVGAEKYDAFDDKLKALLVKSVSDILTSEGCVILTVSEKDAIIPKIGIHTNELEDKTIKKVFQLLLSQMDDGADDKEKCDD